MSKRPTNFVGNQNDFEDSVMSHTFGGRGTYVVKPNFLNLNILNDADCPGPDQASIFRKKRNTTQPPIRNQSLFNTSDSSQSRVVTKKAFAQAGCRKEQAKQYFSYVSDPTKN